MRRVCACLLAAAAATALACSRRTTGDFDGNGRAEILWQNTESGELSAWSLDGKMQPRTLLRPDSPPGGRWRVVATADFDGDHKTDFLLRDRETGSLGIWLMDGLRRRSGVNLPDHPGQEWRVAATGDFDGDGRADIVWHNAATGVTSMWIMTGLSPKSVTTLESAGDTAWVPEGAGDFDGTGRPISSGGTSAPAPWASGS